MIVYVNDTAIRLFSGATAREAVLRYCTDTHQAFTNPTLYDAWGNVIAPDSPMNDGRKIYTATPQ